MHYVDEGSGEPVLFVHGTPTWSFLYREQIRQLSRSCRCIAPDHLGFGLSDKPAHADYSPQAHSRRLELLVEHLGLRDLTLVVHDFGGPIGLAFALRHPEKIRRIVLFNTWLWETAQEKAVQHIDRLLNSLPGKFLYLCLNASPRFLIPQAFHDKRILTAHIHRHYTGVFPSSRERHALLEIGRALKGASAWYGEQQRNIGVLADKPALILWGLRDAMMKESFLRRWQHMLPNSRTVTFDCGHFVQEERAGETAQEMDRFIRE